MWDGLSTFLTTAAVQVNLLYFYPGIIETWYSKPVRFLRSEYCDVYPIIFDQLSNFNGVEKVQIYITPVSSLYFSKLHVTRPIRSISMPCKNLWFRYRYNSFL